MTETIYKILFDDDRDMELLSSLVPRVINSQDYSGYYDFAKTICAQGEAIRLPIHGACQIFYFGPSGIESLLSQMNAFDYDALIKNIDIKSFEIEPELYEHTYVYDSKNDVSAIMVDWLVDNSITWTPSLVDYITKPSMYDFFIMGYMIGNLRYYWQITTPRRKQVIFMCRNPSTAFMMKMLF
jgi:hypothetical protein